MNWTTQRHAGERLLEWGAPAVLAAAAGWAAFAVSGSVFAGVGAAAAAMVAGVVVMRRTDVIESGIVLRDYAIEPIDTAVRDELLLDDPLVAVAADSRVVSIFESDDEAATPGVLVARIADYLGDRSPQARETNDRGADRVPTDAGAALHEALANIRASLR